MISIDDIRTIALALPGAYEHPTYGGRPSWRTTPRMFAWLREAPEALVVWVGSVDEKEALLAADPQAFHTTTHYDGHAIVLVDIDAVDHDEAAELIVDSWRLRAPRRLVTEHGAIT